MLLAARSEYFAGLFRTGDSMRDGASSTVRLPGTPVPALRVCLRYIYTGELPREMEATEAATVLPTADLLLLLPLKERCGKALAEAIDLENVCEMLRLAHAHSIEGLWDVAAAYAAQHFGELTASDAWKAMPHQVLVEATKAISQRVVLHGKGTSGNKRARHS